VQIHILSFEGPDPYARAGGVASRVTGMAAGLAERGIGTHLWFVGDPDRPGCETHENLTLHRWCQWISRYHPVGVYDGESGKEQDFARSLPPHLIAEFLTPALATGEPVAVLAEEWQTVNAVLHLDWLLRCRGLRDQVSILWTANNVFGFDRIDWKRLNDAAAIATVSRYMRERMRALGVNALVLPNGIGSDAFVPAETKAVKDFAGITHGRTTLTKMARWDPDKRWLGAIESIAALCRSGERPLLIARGGAEAHGDEVLARARHLALGISRQPLRRPGAHGLLDAMYRANGADIIVIDSHVDVDARRLLLHASDAVLANSVHEPFGLVGLETMAVGGLACTGCTGEDYTVPGKNAIALQTGDPRELSVALAGLRANPSRERALRRAAQRTARDFYWPRVLERCLLPQLQLEVGARCAA
jgi:glycosyltransferase involved in cell wall biosynthesis